MECAAPIVGRYITLQRIKDSSEPALNIAEVLFYSDTVGNSLETIQILHQNPSRNGNCPKEYPKAGRHSNGFLNYDSNECYGESMACEGGCVNHGYQRYGCYMEDVDLTTAVDLGHIITETPEACEEHAISVNADAFVWCKPEMLSCGKFCFPKSGNIKVKVPYPLQTWMGILPCS